MAETPDLTRAEQAVHTRTRLAFAAAAALPGELAGWEVAGLRVLLCTSPGLSFLTGVTGVDEQTVGALPGVLAGLAARGAERVLVTGTADLAHLGLARAAPRPIGVRSLDSVPVAGGLRVTAGSPDFVELLVRGYGAPDDVAALLAAEHADPQVHGFLAWRGAEPVAAAALSLHGDVAVLGGASTLPAHRGAGAQAALLGARLRAARDAGATMATATAAAGSASARNLARAGFTVHERPAWSWTAGHGPAG